MNTYFIFRIEKGNVEKLHKLSLRKKCSASELIRNAIYEKYNLTQSIRKVKYKSHKRPGKPHANWTEKELVTLVRLYNPGKHGSKKTIATKLGRSYWSIKHKVNNLQLAKAI
jgi:hypothetical protein